MPKKKKNDVGGALKSAARVFVGILVAYATVAIPFTLYIQAFLGLSGLLILAGSVSFGWFWIALWRQKNGAVYRDNGY